MANETDYVTIEKYNFISEQVTKYVGCFLYIVCLFGTLMNILTFYQQKYKTRSCSLYLLVASICDLIHLNLDPLSNILQYGFNYNWTIDSLIYCKIRSYFAYIFTISSGTLTILASITQYLLSSEKSSRWYYARRHIGIRGIKMTFLFWFIISIPIIFCSKCVSHRLENKQLIYSNSVEYKFCYLVQLIYICLFNGFVPLFILMIFGLLTQSNVRHLHRRSKNKSIRIRRINQQLILMLILQSIKSTFASVTYSIFNCYLLKTITNKKTLLYQAKENFIYQIVYALFWSNYTSFFVYIYSSEIFRDQWLTAINNIISYFYRRRQRRYSFQTSRINNQL